MDEHAESTLPPKSNLPPDAPWWARWLEPNLQHIYTAAVAVAGGLAEFYAQDPADAKAVALAIFPASWWPHILASGTAAYAIYRVVKLKGKP